MSNIDESMNQLMKEVHLQQTISDAIKKLAAKGATEEQAHDVIRQLIVSSYPKKREQATYLEILRETMAWNAKLFKASAISE